MKNMSGFCLPLMFMMILLVFSATSLRQIPMNWETHAEHSHRIFELIKQDKIGFMSDSPNGSAVADYSTLVSVDSLKCLRNNGFIATIPRCYQSNGLLDRNFPQNNRNAIAAGFEYNDCYLFPCPTCGDPEGQFNELWNSFGKHSLKVGMVWIDIEGIEYWMDKQSNINFFTKMLNQARSIGAAIGIYASKSQWDVIFGSWQIPQSYPLWYAHYNFETSCRSFSPFGGFKQAVMHQFQGTTTQCGASIDISSYC